MANDPEARAAGNSAMIIGIVVLVLIVGAIAYFATNREADGPDVVQVPGSSTVVKETTREVPVPAPNSGGSTVVVQPQVPSSSTSTKVESKSSTTTGSSTGTGTGTDTTTTTDTTKTEVK